MRTKRYYPSRQGDQIQWLTNFSVKLPPYTGVLGLTAPQVTASVADCNWLIYVLQLWLPAVRAWALSGTEALAEAQTGVGNSPQILPLFTPPALPIGTAAVNPGALDRIFALVQAIKEGGKTTDTINTNLRIVGSEQTPPDYATLQPVLAASIAGGQVHVKWGWEKFSAFLDSCELQVDRGDGKGFGLLTIDTTPNYTDTQSFPAPGQSALWKYKGIYHQGDQRVGQWSDVASVAVAG